MHQAGQSGQHRDHRQRGDLPRALFRVDLGAWAFIELAHGAGKQGRTKAQQQVATSRDPRGRAQAEGRQQHKARQACTHDGTDGVGTV